MSEATATVSTEQKAVVVKKVRNMPTPEQSPFSMTFWEDERLARKFIKENLLFIAQKSADEGVKAHFSRLKDNGEGLAVMEVQFSQEITITEKGVEKKVIAFTGDNYLRVTFDPNRKFPKSDKADKDKKKATVPTFVKGRS